MTIVDFTGAMYVRNEGTVGEYEMYVCLFTRASTWAIHLKVVTDLTEMTFQQAFQRFAARRSLLSLVLSDNASTVILVSTSL